MINNSKQYLLDKNFEKILMCIIPGYENSLCGKITYDVKNGISLQILLPMNEFDLSMQIKELYESMRTSNKSQRIHGILETGEVVSFDIFILVGEHTNQRARVMTFKVISMFIGNDVLDDDMTFNKIIIDYTSLHSWLVPESFKITPERTEKSKIEFMMKYTHPENIDIKVNNNVSLQLNYGFSMNYSMVIKNFTMFQSAAAVLISKEMLSIYDLKTQIKYFRNFLMLATDTLIQEKTIQAKKNDIDVTVFLDPHFQNDIVNEQDIHDMNFTYNSIKETFATIISDWFTFSKKYEKSLTLYFETLQFQKSYPLEIEFLRIVQSLEAFHRIKNPELDTCLKNRFIDLINTTHTLKILKYIADCTCIFTENEPNKHERQPNIKKCVKCCKFADDVVTIRNYHSHGYLKDKEKKLPLPVDTMKILDELYLLIFICIVNEMSIPKELKTEIINKKISKKEKIKYI